jgi:predicted dehydrogenase
MLRIAIVGCGKIADSHASCIERLPDCEIVAACDRESLMAQQFADRFGIERSFTDLQTLLRETAPDVVHITTPPATHYELARLCLEHGCHVYVEKPFTVTELEARRLIALATERKLKITAGHDGQFTPAARRMRALVEKGCLGEAPVHMESYYCYDFVRDSYGRALLGDKRHWVRQLPGKLLHNVISHGIARIAEHLSGESPRVIAYGFSSPLLRESGEREIVDELRVIIADERGATAYFTFSSQMRPQLNEFRILGTGGGLALDQSHETVIRLRGTKFKSYAEKFIPPLILARQYVANFSANLRAFLARDFHMKSGMKTLIEAFYQSIRADTPPPIPHREIVLVGRIMDAIFEQLAAAGSEAGPFAVTREYVFAARN